MSLVARDPFEAFKVMDTFFNPPKLRVSEDPVKINSYKTDTHYHIRAVVPGFTKDEITISVRERILNISGLKESSQEENNMFSSNKQSFQQIYELPRDVIGDEIEADMKNGILVVSIPRWLATESEARKIPIGNKTPEISE